MANQKLKSLCRKCRKLVFSDRNSLMKRKILDFGGRRIIGIKKLLSSTFLKICHSFLEVKHVHIYPRTMRASSVACRAGYRPRYIAFDGGFMNGISKRTTGNIYFR